MNLRARCFGILLTVLLAAAPLAAQAPVPSVSTTKPHDVVAPNGTHNDHDDPPEMRLARSLLATPQLREELTAKVGGGIAPAPTGSEFAMMLFRNDQRIWAALEAELPRLLAKRIPQERLVALADSYRENPEEWTRSGSEMTALVLSLMQDAENLTSVARIGCVAGLLAPNIDAARKKAGKEDTPFKADQGFYEKIQPILQPVDKTCDCIVRHFLKEASGNPLGLMAQEDAGPRIQQLIDSGECPSPIPGDQ